MKWLIVGTGKISSSFYDNLLLAKENPVAVLSRNNEKVNIFAKGKKLKTFTNKNDIDIEYDAVYIATPNSTHYTYALYFINKRKNVLVEKVMTSSENNTRELFEAGRENNVKVMEAFTHISNPIIANLAKKKYRSFKANYFQKSSHVKNNTISTASTFSKELYGGVTADIAIYIISIAVYLLGNVDKIEVFDYDMINGVDGYVSFQLNHINGSQSTMKASKLKDGDNSVYLDDKKILTHPTMLSNENYENRMVWEIKNFVNNDISKYSNMSIEISRIVRAIKDIIYR